MSVAGVNYEVDPDLAGETVILWWGIFDNELYVEHGDKRFGPYAPVGGPIPLYRYRAFKKSPTQQRADRIEALAEQLALPRASGCSKARWDHQGLGAAWVDGENRTGRQSSCSCAYP